MLGQHHHRLVVEQAGAARLFQVGGELQLQSLAALVVTGEQLGLDAQQIAALAGLALVERDFAAQVGQVMADRTHLGPQQIAAEQGEAEDQREEAEKSEHRAVAWRIQRPRVGMDGPIAKPGLRISVIN
ncbi:hypothetical protein D9M68_627400 [compost metagenome]